MSTTTRRALGALLLVPALATAQRPTLAAARSTRVPEGAQILDLTGKSVIPGLVMMHEHLYYPTGPGVYGADYVSFSRLYLAGGVTSMRTGGNVGGYADLNLAAAIKAGNQVG